MFYDSNDVQLSSMTDEVTSENTAKKYEAWGWNVISINGHDHDQIRKALGDAHNEKERPTLIIGKTIMGKGCVTKEGKMYEGEFELHGKPIGDTKADYTKTLINLGANSEQPFDVFKDVQEYYATVLTQKIATVAKQKNKIANWKNENPVLAEKLELFLSGTLPELDLSLVVQKANAASRDASSAVLAYLAENVENIIEIGRAHV